MIETELEQELKQKVDRANTIIKASLISILVLIVLMLGAILTQNELNLARSRDQAAQNHRRTQAYVKCVAEALTVPLKEREKTSLEDCTEVADQMTLPADNQGK